MLHPSDRPVLTELHRSTQAASQRDDSNMGAEEIESLWKSISQLQEFLRSLVDGGESEAELACQLAEYLVSHSVCNTVRIWRQANGSISPLAAKSVGEMDAEPFPDLDTAGFPAAPAKLPRIRLGLGPEFRSAGVTVMVSLGESEYLGLDVVFGVAGPEAPPSQDQVDFSCAIAEILCLDILRVERTRLARWSDEMDKAWQGALRLHWASRMPTWGDALALAGQSILGFDRAWVFESTKHGIQLRGASLPRAEWSSAPGFPKLLKLAEAIARRGIGYQYTVGEGLLTESGLADLARDWIECARLRRIRVEPLRESKTSQVLGVLVLDGYLARESGEVFSGHRIWEHVSEAFANGVERSRLSSLARVRQLVTDAWESHPARAVAIGAFLLGLLSAIPWPLQIDVTGRLQPITRRGVFAPADAVVSRLIARDGQLISRGDVVLELRSPELETTLNTVLSELGAKEARLASLRATRSTAASGSQVASSAITAEQEELEISIAGLGRQVALLRERLASLRVQSPITGMVDRWNLDEVLADRPVIRGQEMLRILDTEGNWRVELEIPEGESGYVTAALARSPRLPVRLQFRHSPGVFEVAALTEVSSRAEWMPEGILALRGLVPLAGPGATGRRAGSGVLAQIECGRRALGFVAIRRVLEFFWRNWW